MLLKYSQGTTFVISEPVFITSKSFKGQFYAVRNVHGEYLNINKFERCAVSCLF